MYTPPCLFFRPCRNFSDYLGIFLTLTHFQGGIFPTMSEFFPACRNFSHHVGIFPIFHPICREKSAPCWWKGSPVYMMQKNAVGGSKNIPLTAEGIIRHMEGNIPQECRNTFLFFTVSLPTPNPVLTLFWSSPLVQAAPYRPQCWCTAPPECCSSLGWYWQSSPTQQGAVILILFVQKLSTAN